MELKGEQRIGAPRERVYAALNDAETLRQSIPGCERIEKRSDTEFAATVTMKVGPVKASFDGEVALSDLNPPESYTLTGSGKGGVAGFASGVARVSLREEDGATVLTYSVEAKVGGKIAQLGSRLIDSVARKLSAEFFARFGALVEGAPAAAKPPEPARRKRMSMADMPVWVWVTGVLIVLLLWYLGYQGT